jgi:putative RNA 2'-phosphotransferase
MKPDQNIKRLSKFISYVLGRRPDEFGLVPDDKGFVKLKEFLKAVTEEEGWRHVRQAHINEILLTRGRPGIEVKNKLIRSRDREELPARESVSDLPKLLYTCIRSKAYPVVHRKGIFPQGRSSIILSAAREMAEKIGRRRDRHPVLLTVHVAQAIERGLAFERFGDSIYLTDFVPADCFSGPPLPKEKPDARKSEPAAEKSRPAEAGSFTLDLTEDRDRIAKPGARKKRKEVDWKKDRRKQRRQKQKLWR